MLIISTVAPLKRKQEPEEEVELVVLSHRCLWKLQVDGISSEKPHFTYPSLYFLFQTDTNKSRTQNLRLQVPSFCLFFNLRTFVNILRPFAVYLYLRLKSARVHPSVGWVN